MSARGDMSGKTVLVTGGNSGIGKAAALALAAMGAKVTLLCRSAERGEDAAAEIEAATGSRPDVLVCDLGSLASVRRASEQFKVKHSSLDVLINSAGAFIPTRQLTSDGIERTFAVNYVGTFLLTLLLADLLRAFNGRVINVAVPPGSLKFDFDDYNSEKKFSVFTAMPKAKAGLVMFTRELPKRPEGQGLSVFAMHPGIVATNIGLGLPWLIAKLISWLGTTPEKGADTAVWLASAPELKGQTGKFFTKRRELPITGACANDTDCARAWDLTLKLAKLA